MDEDAWRVLEPGTAHPPQRLRAVRELNDAGIRAGVLMTPIVPGFTSHPAKLEATIKAIADHGAAFIGANVLYLKEGTRLHFMNFLEKHHPELSKTYQRLYPWAYAPKAYAKEVQSIVKMLQSKYEVTEKEIAYAARKLFRIKKKNILVFLVLMSRHAACSCSRARRNGHSRKGLSRHESTAGSATRARSHLRIQRGRM